MYKYFSKEDLIKYSVGPIEKASRNGTDRFINKKLVPSVERVFAEYKKEITSAINYIEDNCDLSTREALESKIKNTTITFAELQNYVTDRDFLAAHHLLTHSFPAPEDSKNFIEPRSILDNDDNEQIVLSQSFIEYFTNDLLPTSISDFEKISEASELTCNIANKMIKIVGSYFEDHAHMFMKGPERILSYYKGPYKGGAIVKSYYPALTA